tara:strand:- start:2026 stop:2433 length:408 start_codon:yes stop_codon:yes gene_type:complete
MSERVSDTKSMIAGMSPELVAGAFDFCTLPFGDARLDGLIPQAHAVCQEAEGVSLILPLEVMAAQSLPQTAPMAQITLNVYSSLEGVGLTAAVAMALAEAGIACNMVAGFHHDHAFVPLARADDALAILVALAGR